MSLRSVLASWKALNISDFQKDLDKMASELGEYDEEINSSRKKLISETKEFKKSCSDDAKKESASILKSFQQQFDSISNKFKRAESIFLLTYKKVIQLPDPAPVLSFCEKMDLHSSKVLDLEAENLSLKNEIKSIENTHEANIKSFEEEIKHLNSKGYQNGVSESSNENSFELRKTLSDLEMCRQNLERENEVLNSKLNAKNEQLNESVVKLGQERKNKCFEIEILAADLEKALERNNTLEKEVYELKEKYGVGSSGEFETRNEIQALNADLFEKESEVLELKHKNASLEQGLRDSLQSFTQKELVLQNFIKEKGNIIATLETKLKETDDSYKKLQREFKILKEMELLEGEFDSKASMNHLIMQRNKKLLNELTSIKKEYQEKEKELHNASDSLLVLQRELRKSKDLNNMLENDLSTLQNRAILPSDLDERSGGIVNRDVDTLSTISSNSETNNTEVLLTILKSQNERYKERNSLLEQENFNANSKLNQLQSQYGSCKSENVCLYEKVRYFKSLVRSNNNTPLLQGKEDCILIERNDEYFREYEKRLDPFTLFHRKERERKVLGMNAFDKFAFSITHFLSRSYKGRVTATLYFFVMHLFILLLLYNYTNFQ